MAISFQEQSKSGEWCPSVRVSAGSGAAVCRRWLSVAVCVHAACPGLGFIAWQLPSLAGPSLQAPPCRLCRCAERCWTRQRGPSSPPAALSGAVIPGLCWGLLPNAISGQEPKAGNPPALPPLFPATPLLQQGCSAPHLLCPCSSDPPRPLPLASPGPAGETSVPRAWARGDEGVRVPQSSRSQTSLGFVQLGLSPAAKSVETSFTGTTS